jgi:hypothetical protein
VSDTTNPFFGININLIARVCRVDVTTARRWKSGARCPPESAVLLIQGDLRAFDPAWSGWRILKGKLISREGWEFSVGDVLAIPFLHGQVRVYQGELRKMKEMSALQEQPAPGEWPEWSLPIAR